MLSYIIVIGFFKDMKQITPIHLLRSFEAAARHSSFTLAAEELHITQAAVSKQIKSLEKELNRKLFNRNAHGVNLTQAGERYWHDTRSLVNKLDNITTQLFTERNVDTLRIRVNISYSVELLAEKIKWFQTHHPEITLEITHSVWSKENQHSNADIEIDYRTIDPKNKEYRLLAQDQIFPVISNDLNTGNIKNLPTIHILGYYNEWDWWLQQATETQKNKISSSFTNWMIEKKIEIKQNKNILRVDNSLIAYKLTIQGAGIALARTSLAKPYLDNKLLKKIANNSSYTAREGFHVYLTDSGRDNKVCKEFADYLLK